MNKVLTKFYVWYMYSSTSCIALINCKRGVNKQVLFKLWVNINIIFSFLYNAGQAYKHARVCNNENSSWRDEILQYIDKNYAKCVSKVLVLYRLSSWTETRAFPQRMNNQCKYTIESKNEQKNEIQTVAQCDHKVCVY